jgi:hypothetical protein
VLASHVIASDDTPVTLLTPGVGKGSRQARFWIYRGIHEAPYNIFAFTDSRAREGPDRFLETFHGILLGDCYSGYVNIEQVTGGRIEFSACVAHGRRKVFLSREQCPALSSPLLALLGELYDIEDRGRLLSDAQRLLLRQQESVPVMARLRAVLDSELARGVLPKSKFGQALSYLISAITGRHFKSFSAMVAWRSITTMRNANCGGWPSGGRIGCSSAARTRASGWRRS